MNFGFPSTTNYAQSQVSSPAAHLETNYNGVENGGLFSREECRNLAKYNIDYAEKLYRPMMGTMTASARLFRWPNGW